MPTIKTAVGDLAITEIQVADRVPPDCDTSLPACHQATESYQFLVILLERAEGDPIGIADMAKLIATDYKEIYVIAGDDSRIDATLMGLLGSLSYVAFLAPASAQDFTLLWPDNPPIKLGK
jgi:hypothetical protein